MMAQSFVMTKRNVLPTKRSWHGAGFVVESLLLLLFLAFTISVVVQMVSASYAKGVEADRLADAVLVATDEAELFTADPSDEPVDAFYRKDGGFLALVGTSDSLRAEELGELRAQVAEGEAYEVVCTPAKSSTSAGHIYDAQIDVSCGGAEVYSVFTSVYVPDPQGGGTVG